MFTYMLHYIKCSAIHFPYSQGQKYVIQLKNSQELISPNMSSQFQLENSSALIFISTGRCQLEDFRGTPLEFCFEGPSLSARCQKMFCVEMYHFETSGEEAHKQRFFLGNVALREAVGRRRKESPNHRFG